MPIEIILGAAAGILCLSLTAGLTVGAAAMTKDIWDTNFGTGNVREDQARDLANQIRNLATNMKELKSEVGVTVSHLQKNIKELKSDVGVTVRLIQEELKKETKPSYIVEFLQNDKTIYVVKVALVGAIGYGVWKWMGYSVSDIRNGTKRFVAGTLLSMTKNLEKNSGEVGEKLRILSEQLENCGKADEPKEMSNPKKVIEVSRNISQNGNVVDLNKKLYDLVPLEDPNAKVWRPTIGIQIMEEALKSIMAWPTDHILYESHHDNEASGNGFDSGN
ncbi:hypothetical protein FRX31_014415 [Thalictrum thalictroides]|uniref:DUF1664 domain-containing protein n=1 Tax=Thalictrum thalictroides TaxID=46969 RepID=A0A7J6WGG3_THATH|nr:hypothetical protein FRX31_014415 [Thalictrum thalictroides]